MCVDVIMAKQKNSISKKKKKKEKKISHRQRCDGSHPVCDTLSHLGLNSIKLAYDPRRSDSALS